MLSVSTCTSAMAFSYYEAENAGSSYYTKDIGNNDTWHGALCEEIGLKEGQSIQAEHFKLLLEVSGEKCSGYDLTFSAPKSVSIAMEMNEELRKDMVKAHHEAVYKTLKEIEEKEVFTRLKENGRMERVRTGKIAAACFDHETGRPDADGNIDMQLHTHCVVLNATPVDGKMYTVDGHRFFEIQKLYGLEYRNRLAGELSKMGYEIRTTDAEQGFFELADIRDDVIANFSKRAADINKCREESGASYVDAKTVTRNAKKSVDIEVQRNQWQDEIRAMGQIEPVKHQPLKFSDNDYTGALNRAVDRLEEMDFAFERENLVHALMSEGCGMGITMEKAGHMIDESSRCLPVMNIKNGRRYYTTQKNIDVEKEISRRIIAGRGCMQGLAKDTAENTLRTVCRENGWHLSDQQSRMVLHIAESRDQFTGVIGLAGTGKTFSLNAAREVLERAGYEVKGMSATGQAAQELSADANIRECSTIHRTLNSAEKEAGNLSSGDYTSRKSWNFDGLAKSAKPTVWFVDEASLTNNTLFVHIQRMAALRGDKVVL